MKKRLWYYKNNSFEARREFAAELTPDTIFVPLYTHFDSQNLPKIVSWGRLGAAWGRPGESERRLGSL